MALAPSVPFIPPRCQSRREPKVTLALTRTLRYHCVTPLTRGTRQVLVLELWQGTENRSPTRDEAERWQGEWRDELQTSARIKI